MFLLKVQLREKEVNKSICKINYWILNKHNAWHTNPVQTDVVKAGIQDLVKWKYVFVQKIAPPPIHPWPCQSDFWGHIVGF